MTFDLKGFFDAKLFGGVLLGWEHKLKLVSFLTAPTEDGLAMVLVFLESGAFAEDVVGLLEHGAKIDYFRYPSPVDGHVIFGGDGMPGISAADGDAVGLARGRLALDTSPRLVMEVRALGTAEEAIKRVQGFYDLVKEKLKTGPEELVRKYGAR